MTKLVVLKLDGDLQQGVRVTLSIALEGVSPHKEVTGNLPAVTELQTTIDQWRSHYRSLGSGNRAIKAKKVTYDGSITQKQSDCKNSATELKKRLNNWLLSESFRSIRESWLKELQENEIVRILIRTSNPQLRQIPWHLWDLVEEYPHAELALSATDYQKTPPTKTPSMRGKVKVLAILGNSTGIDVQTDRRLLNSLPDADVTFLVQPQRYEINDQLWEKPWDILFFAGHSQTVEDSGRIYINENQESLTTDDLKYGLKKAKSNGLAVAIFNSCDGLGLASDLETLHIPQIIVMREQVPDEVAQVFLKHFLSDFASGSKSLYQAVKEARLKLHGLEDKYPCASWLPVICQNTDANPPHWLDLGRCPTDIIPYRGLFAFGEEDAQFFFGRETFTNMLVDAVQNQPLVAVIGSSGSGKSSVVFAGLVKRLRDAGNWHIVDFRPGSRPLFNLATALVDQQQEDRSSNQKESQVTKPVLSRTERLREMRNLASDLGQYQNGLRDVVDDILKQNPSQHFLLIADQFEELYTLCTDAQERQTFLDRLLEAICRCRHFTFVITLRADFLGQALSYRPFADALQYADLKLGPMTDEELQAVVEKPANLLGVTIEQGLVERILATISVEPGNLPLLEFALTQLWAKQLNAQLNHAAYDEIGGVEAALASYADQAYNKLNFEEKERTQRIFIQLVHPGEGAEDTRRIATRTEVGEENWDLVTRLADARLVVTGRDEKTGLDTVEVVHEALIRNWGQLHRWMQQDRDFRHWQEQLRVAMRTWESSGFDEGALLRGKPLADAEYWERQRFLELSPVERSFIRLSVEFRERESRKKKRRRQFTVFGLSGGLVVALSLTGVAWWQSQNSAKNEIISLTNSSEALLTLGQEFDALKTILKAAKKVTQIQGENIELKIPITVVLGQVMNEVKQFNRLQEHNSYIRSVIFSPDGETIATGSDDQTVKLWNRKGQMLKSFDAHARLINSISFSPDGQIVTNSNDDTAKLWSREGKLIATFVGHEDNVNSAAFSPDSNILATASTDKTVKLWNTEGKLLKTFTGHNEQVNRVTFSPDGKTLATASNDKTVKLWNTKGKLLKTFTGHEGHVNSVTFSPDGETLVTASNDKTVKLWNREGKLLKTFVGHSDAVHSATFSRDGKTLASASTDNTVILWKLEHKLFTTLTQNNEQFNQVAFSPDGKILATTGNDKTAKLWNREGKLLKTLTGHSDRVNRVTFSPDGKILVTTSNDQTVKLWNRQGQLVKTLTGHKNRVNSVTFSHDNSQTFATASDDHIVKLWSREGQWLKTFTAQHNDQLNSVTFSPDGQILATTSNDTTAKLWNRDGQLLKTLTGHSSWVNSATFSSDSQTLATTSEDKTVKLWNREGKLLKTLIGHSNHTRSVSFSPDGKILATASEDKTVKLWNRDGQLLQTLTGHTDVVNNATFSPDGKTLATAGNDKRVILWNFDFADLQMRGCTWFADYLITHPDALNELEQCETPAIRAASAFVMVTQGEKLIIKGDIEDGIAKFRTALNWNPTKLKFNLTAKVEALTKVKEGEDAGRQCNLEVASAKFQSALELDPNLGFEPQTKARQFVSLGLIRKGEKCAANGKIWEAIAAYAQAQKFDPSLEISPSSWSHLCWFGSLHKHAADVIYACEQAVALVPNDGEILDSRGLARALTGNTEGAIADFQAFIAWTSNLQDKLKRQHWINTLRTGMNPFTDKEIQSLF
ncbi:nSTAND1 domain-containing NTPase [Calothrix sp. NIES-3974]|uniref:nSTAND1 domain-containing NTPase n=1 Tax=Calothrix sp. NIES-3974 TaxID=2005462 RepID=UPI000B5DC811|nr:CHAT domain-containing protein [Calothrix sp. NIES-3974]BAZ06025.1 WD-repeat protein [Calothrix sp. NIES-3974]